MELKISCSKLKLKIGDIYLAYKNQLEKLALKGEEN